MIIRIALSLFLLLSATCLAEPGDHLKADDKLPAVIEKDQFGEERAFQDLLGPEGAILVVFRSADW